MIVISYILVVVASYVESNQLWYNYNPNDNEVFETQTRVTSSSNVTFDGCAFRYTDGDVLHTQVEIQRL